MTRHVDPDKLKLASFGEGEGRLRRAVAERIDNIARRHGAWFVRRGILYYFEMLDAGDEENARKERAVLEHLSQLGLWPVGDPHEHEA